ncbi:MAG: ABC transporter ATP-binding protein [Desulfobacterota bacterium]|nr:ABC transporter ATP-binding protein [Thermodesulfobacteriota bacterium]
MIEVERLSKSYGTTKAVQDISFTIAQGEVVGFLGPNGAGKSTTMRMLTCYLCPDSGTARIAGFDITQQPREVKKRIGYLPENNPLYMDMGVVEYLRFIAAIRNLPSDSVKPNIQRVIEVCGLEAVVAKDIGELSKGYRQRLGLAQALLHDPDVLILDEPTIGLDPHQIIEIRNLIKNIGRHKTVILSSHILPEVSATCDRVLIINRGVIVGSGTPAELAALSRGKQTILVTVKGPHAEVAAGLRTLTSVVDVVPLETEDGYGRFELICSADAPSDMAEQVFFLVSRSGWSLSELYRKTVNLEDVFLDLTTREET